MEMAKTLGEIISEQLETKGEEVRKSEPTPTSRAAFTEGVFVEIAKVLSDAEGWGSIAVVIDGQFFSSPLNSPKKLGGFFAEIAEALSSVDFEEPFEVVHVEMDSIAVPTIGDRQQIRLYKADSVCLNHWEDPERA